MRPSLTVLSLTFGLVLPASLSAQEAENAHGQAEKGVLQQLQALESALSPSPTAPEAPARQGGHEHQEDRANPAAGGAFLGVQLAMDDGPGVLVAGALPGKAAAEAGIRAGDRVLAIGGAVVSDFAELQGIVKSMSPGDQVVVLVTRGEKNLEFSVVLGSRDADPRSAERAGADDALSEHLAKMQAWREGFEARLDAMARELEAHNAESEAWMGRFDPNNASPQLRRQLDAEWLRRARSAQDVERLRQRLERGQQGQAPRARRALPQNMRDWPMRSREEAAEDRAGSMDGKERATDQLHKEVEELRASIEELRRKLAEMER